MTDQELDEHWARIKSKIGTISLPDRTPDLDVDNVTVIANQLAWHNQKSRLTVGDRVLVGDTVMVVESFDLGLATLKRTRLGRVAARIEATVRKVESTIHEWKRWTTHTVNQLRKSITRRLLPRRPALQVYLRSRK